MAAGLGLAACGSGDPAPVGSVVRLDFAEAAIGGLEAMNGVAELPDRRVVIPQAGVPSVLLADFTTGALDTIGRSGDGPGEYRYPSMPVVRQGLPGVLDVMQHRLTLWHSDGTPDTTITIADLAYFDIRLDTLGNVYAAQPPRAGFIVSGQEIDSTSPKDSTWIYRMHPPEPGRDTVARLYEVGWAVVKFKNGVTRMRRLYESADQWGVLPDGSIWILRGQQNRVDRLRDGRWTIGQSRTWTPIKTTDRDREYLTGRFFAAEDSIEHPMVETKGPYQGTAVAGPDGEVWARLNEPAGSSASRYELFPAAGPSTQTVQLPPDRQVVTVTAKYVYATHEDDNGFLTLERYPRP